MDRGGRHGGRPLRVLFLSVEVESFAKTGGLGDVAAALPKALRRLGVDVRVCLPRHGSIPESRLDPEPVVPPFDVPIGDWREPVTIRRGWLRASGVRGRVSANEKGLAPSSDAADGKGALSPLAPVGAGSQPSDLSSSFDVPVYLVESARYFNRPHLYGYPDDGERFIIYCRAAMELCRHLGWAPDVIHCNDWHTALVPNWLNTVYEDDPFFAGTVSVYTIHNLAYQGIFDFHFLWLAGIAEYGFLYPKVTELAHVVDLMGRGILFADAITTVSERYAREILTPEYGERLDPLLHDRQDRLFGILNGIDVDELDPRVDPHLPVRFGVDTLDRRLEGKLALQREASLPADPKVPLVAMIGRLSGQKGLDIVGPALEALLRRPLQFIVLGTGDEHYARMLRDHERTHPEQMKAFLTFDTPLAQRIYGATDIFLMPSRYEPCGLGQMIAMRYGAVPVVRATGGLADTVQDWDPATGTGNGFTFDCYDSRDLLVAVARALETYRYPDVWRRLQEHGMTADFSWERSARKYLSVYQFALRSKERSPTAS